MMVMLDDLHAALLKMAYRLIEELRREQDKEREAIADAVRTKMYIGDKYWERRHMIEQRLRAVRGLLAATEQSVE